MPDWLLAHEKLWCWGIEPACHEIIAPDNGSLPTLLCGLSRWSAPGRGLRPKESEDALPLLFSRRAAMGRGASHIKGRLQVGQARPGLSRQWPAL